MNKAKWSNPAVPLEILALKLSEEAAEVGNEISDALISPLGQVRVGKDLNIRIDQARQEILTEISHVEFLCSVLRGRLET